MVVKHLELELDEYAENYHCGEIQICASAVAAKFGLDLAELPSYITLSVSDEKRDGAKEFVFRYDPYGPVVEFINADTCAIYGSFFRWLEQRFKENIHLWMSVEENDA